MQSAVFSSCEQHIFPLTLTRVSRDSKAYMALSCVDPVPKAPQRRPTSLTSLRSLRVRGGGDSSSDCGSLPGNSSCTDAWCSNTAGLRGRESYSVPSETSDAAAIGQEKLRVGSLCVWTSPACLSFPVRVHACCTHGITRNHFSNTRRQGLGKGGQEREREDKPIHFLCAAEHCSPFRAHGSMRVQTHTHTHTHTHTALIHSACDAVLLGGV